MVKARTQETVALTVCALATAFVVAVVTLLGWAVQRNAENIEIEQEYKTYCERIGKTLENAGQLGTTLVRNSDRLLVCVVAVPFDVPKKPED